MTFAEFEKALELIAEKKVRFSKGRRYLHASVLGLSLLNRLVMFQGISVDDLKSKLNSASGPKTQATTPDYVKFHDDKVLYSQLTTSKPSLTLSCYPFMLLSSYTVFCCCRAHTQVCMQMVDPPMLMARQT